MIGPKVTTFEIGVFFWPKIKKEYEDYGNSLFGPKKKKTGTMSVGRKFASHLTVINFKKKLSFY